MKRDIIIKFVATPYNLWFTYLAKDYKLGDTLYIKQTQTQPTSKQLRKFKRELYRYSY